MLPAIASHQDCEVVATPCDSLFGDVGKYPGLETWVLRLVKSDFDHERPFVHVKKVSAERFGWFFDRECYLVLNTNENLGLDGTNSLYDAHFWVGRNVTASVELELIEYFTVELDKLFPEGFVALHREVQGHESSLFKSYFSYGIVFVNGEEVNGVCDRSRLFKVSLNKDAGASQAVEAAMDVSSFDSADVVLLDLGRTIYKYEGEAAGEADRKCANQILFQIVTRRKEAVLVTDRIDNRFWRTIGCACENAVRSREEMGKEIDKSAYGSQTQLFLVMIGRPSNAILLKVHSGTFDCRILHSKDVYVIYNGQQIFVWIGKHHFSRFSFHEGLALLTKFKTLCDLPVTRVCEGQANRVYDKFVAESQSKQTLHDNFLSEWFQCCTGRQDDKPVWNLIDRRLVDKLEEQLP